MRTTLGADHPFTLTCRNNLGLVYQAAYWEAEAILLLERTPADRERVLGGDHPDTLASRAGLADVYRAAGRRPRRFRCWSGFSLTGNGRWALITDPP